MYEKPRIMEYFCLNDYYQITVWFDTVIKFYINLLFHVRSCYFRVNVGLEIAIRLPIEIRNGRTAIKKFLIEIRPFWISIKNGFRSKDRSRLRWIEFKVWKNLMNLKELEIIIFIVLNLWIKIVHFRPFFQVLILDPMIRL